MKNWVRAFLVLYIIRLTVVAIVVFSTFDPIPLRFLWSWFMFEPIIMAISETILFLHLFIRLITFVGLVVSVIRYKQTITKKWFTMIYIIVVTEIMGLFFHFVISLVDLLPTKFF